MAKTSAIKANIKIENKSQLAIPSVTVANNTCHNMINSGLISTTYHIAITSAIKTTYQLKI